MNLYDPKLTFAANAENVAAFKNHPDFLEKLEAVIQDANNDGWHAAWTRVHAALANGQWERTR